MNHQFHLEQSPEPSGQQQVSQAQAGSSPPGNPQSAPVSPQYAANHANAAYANNLTYQHTTTTTSLLNFNQQQQHQHQHHQHQDHRLQQQQQQQHYLAANQALLQAGGQHAPVAQQQQVASDDLYARQQHASVSPQVATSPAIMAANQHQQFHQAGAQSAPALPAPMTPYNAHPGYTNGYHSSPHHHHHHHHHPALPHHHPHDVNSHHQHHLHQQQQQLTHQPVQLHHQHQHQHQQAQHQQQQAHQHQQHQHYSHQPQGQPATHYQPQHPPPHHHPHHHHHHQAAFMQLDDAYSIQHTSPVYAGQFSQRNPAEPRHPTGGLSPAGASLHQATHPNNLAVQQQLRHYGPITGGNNNNNNNNNIIKVPTPTSATTISETMLLTSRAHAQMAAISGSPQLHLQQQHHHQQNLIKSPASANSDSQSTSCRRQSSSVMSTGSAGSNLSDHQSSLDSPSSVLAANHPMGVPLTLSQADQINQVPSMALDGAIRVKVEPMEQDVKESRLSQLHQQCADLLDKQQQEQRMVSMNSPGSNPETNNATNDANNTGPGGAGANNNPPNNGNSNTGRSKRLRTSFKHYQLKEMKKKFSVNQNPDAKELRELADRTNLTKRVLQVWFQNARAKFRRNNARAASQQLYDGLGQHNPHMLQFQQQGLQQQSYHHHSHHHHAITIVDQTSMTTVQQQQSQPQQQQQQPPPPPPPQPQQQQAPQQHQQTGPLHHGLTTAAPGQDSPAIS